MIAASDGRFFAASRVLILLALMLLLAGCGGMAKLGGLFSDSGSAAPAGPLPPLEGSAKVALLLPLSAAGDQAQVAIAMKQAAELALVDAGGQSGITLITKDTLGTAAGATTAAQGALAEGAELILGPLLGAEVQAVKPIAAAQNIPVIAFSSSSGVAGDGVYLMSFLPEEEVANIVRHLASSGKTTIAALLPKSQYGLAVERAIVPAGQKHGVSVAVIERFPRNNLSIVDPVNKIAGVVNDPQRKVDTLLIAEGGDLLQTLGAALKNARVDQQRTLIVGTGLWDNPVTPETPIAVGGLYAGVAPDLVLQFDDKYKASYGTRPSRLASLAYDAVSLANTLAREPGGQRFSAANITNPEGFQGMNGLFRFRQNGLVERGLAILKVTTRGVEVQDPAPARFTTAAGATATPSAQQSAN
ncbi:MAG: penicillin-binding protein activator [Pseudomonadota bacterium]|nr:penicillin-binding protein activator [Pseudomonadota bacterium]